MSGFYYIISELNGLALDVENGSKAPGTPISPYQRNGTASQKWYDDPDSGTIRSKLNDFCMDIQGGRLVLNPYKPGKESQLWKRKNNLIMNRSDTNFVLDISGQDKRPRAKVISYQVNYGSNQLWKFELA